MIDTHLQNQGRPFVAAPRHDRYYAADSIEKARQCLYRTIERAEGPALVVGPAGVGKSTLCQLLAHQFQDALRVVVLRCAPLCTRRALLQSILFEFGLPYSSMDEGELRLSLNEHLDSRENGEGGLLLLVDEADALPLRLLEELRTLTNFVREGVPLLSMVLFGGPSLEENFADPSLESFNQRLACRCYLDSFSRDDTFQYMRSQITAVGGAPELMSEEAMQAVYVATEGVPRLINQLCDHAMVMAVVGEHDQLSAPLIEEAWADLQQLPAPRNIQDQHTEGDEGDIIAFGSLDDDFDENWDESAHEASLEKDARDVHSADSKLEEIEQQVEAIHSAFDSPESDAFAQADDEGQAEERESFEPAGVIGPAKESVTEARPEVITEEAVDPFAESFDDEEVVIDRSVESDSALFSTLPHVACEEGRDIAEILSRVEPTPGVSKEVALPDAITEKKPSPHEQPEVMEVQPAYTEQESLAAREASPKKAFQPALDPIYPEESVAEETISEETPQEVPPQFEIEKAADDASPLFVPRWEDDRDIIVISNDTKGVEQEEVEQEDRYALANAAVETKPQEYKQLFARLQKK